MIPAPAENLPEGLALIPKIGILRSPLTGPINDAGLAQLVEQLVYTEWVGGSSPSSRTTLVL